MEVDLFSEKILILDFGSQYTQLIARRVREAKVYCEIHPFNMPLRRFRPFPPKGLSSPEGPPAFTIPGPPLRMKAFST
jgi:GMP synthase (glutamine-hydrolysing)